MTPKLPISKGSEVIHGDIIQNLETADLVLCDMSILNPNVFFELGIRTALNKSVAMIRDNVTERVPFDTTIINYHEYDCGLEPWTLENEITRLTDHLKDCMENGTGNSLWGYFSMTQQAEVPSDAPEVEKQLGYLIKQVEALRNRAAPDRIVPLESIDELTDAAKTKLNTFITGILTEEGLQLYKPLRVENGVLMISTNRRIDEHNIGFVGAFIRNWNGITRVAFINKNVQYAVYPER